MLKTILLTLLLLAVSLPSSAGSNLLPFPEAPKSWLVYFETLRDRDAWALFTESSADEVSEDPQLRQHLGKMTLLLGPEQMPVPLFLYAALRNDIPLLSHLHSSGVRPDIIRDEDPHGYTALSAIAFLYGENGEQWAGVLVDIRPDTFREVLRGVELSSLSATEQYALFDVALMRDDVSLASALIRQGHPLSWTDEFGSNLLTHALWAQAYRVAELLLDAGIDPFYKGQLNPRSDRDSREIIKTALQHLPEGEEGELARESLLRLQQKINQVAAGVGAGFF